MYFDEKMEYCHVYTLGLETDIVFRDKEDFCMGMNAIAVLHSKSTMSILAFVLMSNHFHFILHASKEDSELFVHRFKMLVSKYLNEKYGNHKILRKNPVGVSCLPDGSDLLRQKIAYVLNNPVKAGLNLAPQMYEWSSARCYFASSDMNVGLISFSDISSRDQRRILKSHVKLGPRYQLNSQGYVEPASYVDYKYVESLYRRVSSFQFFLSSSMRQQNDRIPITFRDSYLLPIVKELLEKRYFVKSASDMPDEILSKLVRELSYRFFCAPKQIARLLRIGLNRVERLLKLEV